MDYQRNGWFRPTCGVTRQGVSGFTPTRQANAVRETSANGKSGLWEMQGTSLAMAYSPAQCFHKLYEPCKALSRGTLFAELDLPFSGKC